MRYLIVLTILSIIFLAGCTTNIPFTDCIEEAKICPDGSDVGRNPAKNCEFYPCPVEFVTDAEQCDGGKKVTCPDGTQYDRWNVVDGKCVQINYFVDPCRQEFDSRENCATMGGKWIESKNTCEYPTSRVMQITPELCRQAGGNWNECGSPCAGTGQDFCILMCQAQCECGGIAGFNCPAGYRCRLSGEIADEMGVCIPRENV